MTAADPTFRQPPIDSSPPFPAVRRVGQAIYTSGQVGLSKETGLLPVAFADEVAVAIDNLRDALEAAGSGLSDVVKTTCLLRDLGDLEVFNGVYSAAFAEPRPARTTFQAELARDFRVEIEAVAVIR